MVTFTVDDTMHKDAYANMVMVDSRTASVGGYGDFDTVDSVYVVEGLEITSFVPDGKSLTGKLNINKNLVQGYKGNIPIQFSLTK